MLLITTRQTQKSSRKAGILAKNATFEERGLLLASPCVLHDGWVDKVVVEEVDELNHPVLRGAAQANVVERLEF